MAEPGAGWRTHVIPTLRLALPVMFARAGILILALVDTAMCGRAGIDALAGYGLAASMQIPVLLVGIGMLLGTVVLTARADGAGRQAELGAIFRTGLWHAGVLGCIAFVVCLYGEWFLTLVGQTPTLARGGGQVLVQFGWGLPAALLFSTTVFFLEGLHRPVPGMVVMALANVLNAGLNWLLIFGHAGFPAMGASGAAAATSVVRWFMFISIVAYALWRLDWTRYARKGARIDWRASGRQFRRIGYPMALGQGLESISFATMAIFAGWIGTVAVAAWSIASNVLAIVFMFALGLGTAGGVRVANLLAHGELRAARQAGWVAAGLTVVVIGTLGVMVFVFRAPIVAMYTDGPVVVAVAVSTLAVTAFVLVPDALQAVLVGALRGAWDFWVATGLQILAFWVVMVPLGLSLGILRGGGAPALMTSVGAGVVVATALLGWRFEHIANRPSPQKNVDSG